MKLRYYLRGLGVGVMITTIILSIALNGKKESLTDQEIMKRAKALGMIQQEEDSSNSDETKEDADGTENSDKSETLQDLKDLEDSQTKDTQESTKPEEKSTTTAPQTKKQEDTTDKNATANAQKEMVQVNIQGGLSSDSIAKVLFDAKLVDDAASFNSFLTEKKYDEKLEVGTFEIPKGATYEEVAKILTSQ